MQYEDIKQKVKKMSFILEFILAMFIAASVVIGMVDLVRYMVLIFTTNPIDTYDLFQKFLGHVLLLVVGVELVLMLVFHSPSSVIEVLLYAVARKMLIGNQGMLDFVLGIIAIAAIFAIRRFIFIDDIHQNMDTSSTFSAAMPIKSINELLGLNISDEMGYTIGGVVSNLARSTGRPLQTGAEFNILTGKIRIVKMRNGVIEKVSIKINER